MNLKTIVNKSELLQKVKENKEEFIQLYSEAVEGYVKSCKEELEKALIKVENWNKPENVYLSMTVPRNYTDEYDQAIAMLEWTQDEVIELTPQQFNQLVLNNWEWSNNFYSLNSAYSSGCLNKILS